MDLKFYLAMTAAEFQITPEPYHPAWMACHFSPYGKGISNKPSTLPENTMLILNDRIPPWQHDPRLITMQIQAIVNRNKCTCVLLDFQQERNNLSENIVYHLSQHLNCPVGTTTPYADITEGPVLINCPKPHETLENVSSAWKRRNLWLEVATESEVAYIEGSSCKINSCRSIMTQFTTVHKSCIVHSHYALNKGYESIELSIWRDVQDIHELLKEAQKLNIELAVGLSQQFIT